MKEDSVKMSKGRHSRVLMIITTIYGILYLMFIIDVFILTSEGQSAKNSEQIVTLLLFVVFIIGYIVLWKNKVAGGLIFLLWYIGMGYLGLFVVDTDRGASFVLGFPLFVLAILFIIFGYKSRNINSNFSSDEPDIETNNK